MKLSTVISIGKELAAAYDTSDPEGLCAELGIILLHFPMGTARRSVKGFILKNDGKVAITLNSDLSEDMKRVVFYHEFSHYILHIRTGLAEQIQDCNVYDSVSEAEYEANLLAAELQITDESAMEALRETGDFFTAAGILRVPPELLDFKIRILRDKGHQIPCAPLTAAGSYLRDLGTGAAS